MSAPADRKWWQAEGRKRGENDQIGREEERRRAQANTRFASIEEAGEVLGFVVRDGRLAVSSAVYDDSIPEFDEPYSDDIVRVGGILGFVSCRSYEEVVRDYNIDHWRPPGRSARQPTRRSPEPRPVTTRVDADLLADAIAFTKKLMEANWRNSVLRVLMDDVMDPEWQLDMQRAVLRQELDREYHRRCRAPDEGPDPWQ